MIKNIKDLKKNIVEIKPIIMENLPINNLYNFVLEIKEKKSTMDITRYYNMFDNIISQFYENTDLFTFKRNFIEELLNCIISLDERTSDSFDEKCFHPKIREIAINKKTDQDFLKKTKNLKKKLKNILVNIKKVRVLNSEKMQS